MTFVPNSPFSDLVGSLGTLGAANATATINAFGYHSVGMLLAAGTLVGTIVPECSLDGGTTWVSTFFVDPALGNSVSSIVFGSSNTVTSRTISVVGGASNYRVRVSAYTSGTASCTLRANETLDVIALDTGSAGGGLPPTIAQIGGSVTTATPTYSNGTLNALSLDTSGNVRVNICASALTDPAECASTQNVTAPSNVLLAGGQFNTTPSTISTGKVSPLQMDSAGNLLCNIKVASQTSGSSTAGACAQTSVSTSSVSVLATNAARKECIVVNTGLTTLYLGLGQTPTITAYHIALSACQAANDGSGGTYQTDMWKGAINAIGSAAAGTCVVTELT